MDEDLETLALIGLSFALGILWTQIAINSHVMKKISGRRKDKR